MKFRINTEQFSKSVKPAVDIALKNTIKEFKSEGIITLEAHPSTLHIKAYGGTASILVKMHKKDGYIFEERGVITVNAKALDATLKSLDPTKNLTASDDGPHQRLILKSGRNALHELLTYSANITIPRKSRSFTEKVQVDRNVFINGLKKVSFAMASEEKMYHYMCTYFESSKDKMTFSAGSGGRFAVAEFEGGSRVITSGEIKILFPKTNISNITRILKNDLPDKITIKNIEANSDKNIHEQILITTGNITIALYGTENFTKYPDLSVIVNHDYPYEISTSVKDWINVPKAISATYHSHYQQIHNTRVEADIQNNLLTVSPRTAMTVSRKMPFEPKAFVANSLKKKKHNPWFHCNSEYLIEIDKQGYKNGNVIVKFECQSKLDGIPANKPKQMKPVLMEYPERTNKDGIKEKYSVFFTVSTK